MTRRHVVLLTYGEPPRPDFFAQLRYSWRILLGLTRSVADIPALLLPLIAVTRAWSRVALWRRHAFVSPLEPLTRAQAEGLATALVATAPRVSWQVHVAYEFRDPLLLDLVTSLPAGEPVDVVPMYAADSAFTHQLARDTLARGLARDPSRAAHVRVLPPLPLEIQADLAARHVKNEIARNGLGGDTALVLAAHGTLLAPPRPYETGRLATERLARDIARRVEGAFGTVELGWLNHAFGGRWTEPPVDQLLRRMTERGIKRVIYFPFGFLADNAESLLEGRIALQNEPGLEAIHLPCLNATSGLMAALANQIVAAMSERDGEPAPTRIVERAAERESIRARAPQAQASPAPEYHGARAAHAAHGDPPVQRCLDQLEPGERSVILRLDGHSGPNVRLMELGFVPGTPIEMVRRAPFGDPVEFRLRDVSLSIRRSEMRRIHIVAV